MRVLIIESDDSTAETLEIMLKNVGATVYTTDLGEEGVDLAKIYNYDAIVLETSLPDMSGLDVVRQLRAAKVPSPILILSATSEIGLKVKLFATGADDYLTKPFHSEELWARLQAIVRRTNGWADSVIDCGGYTVNLQSKTVDAQGKRIPLTEREYQMMELMALRRGSMVTREAFMNHLYGGMDEPEMKIIDVFLCKLRKKLREANGGEDNIATIWGRGYMLRNPQVIPAVAA